MSESTNNPLNDFLNAAEPENDLFAALPFAEEEEPTPPAAAPAKEEQLELPQAQQQTPPAKQTMFAEALAQTPAAQQQEEDPFAAALKKAKAQSDERLTESFSEKDAVFSYGKAKDPISEHDCTFEELRQKYETDFPELSESKKVSWTMIYGKVEKYAAFGRHHSNMLRNNPASGASSDNLFLDKERLP